MDKANGLKLCVAASALAMASPAVASDFSGFAYIFIGLALVVGLFAFLLVALIRHVSDAGGQKVDAVSAVLVAAAIAPVGAVGGSFSLFPAWIFFLLDGFAWDELLSPLVSFAVTSGVLFYIFREVRLSRAAKQQEGDL